MLAAGSRDGWLERFCIGFDLCSITIFGGLGVQSLLPLTMRHAELRAGRSGVIL